MDSIRITIVQSHIIWEQPNQNLKHYDDLIRNVDGSDIIILPEMFSSGFSTVPSEQVIVSAPKVLNWMKIKASEKNCAICGSMIVREKDRLLNRFYFVLPDGNHDYYDKKHLFGLGRENEFFSQGNSKITIRYRGINIRPYICYDLRFPVWNKNTYNTYTEVYEYDLAIYVANWPEQRIQHWEKLLQARAIENQVYVCGVNRIGEDPNGISYNGRSQLIHPLGHQLLITADNKESVHTIAISLDELRKTRTSLPFAHDWDHFEIL